MSVEQLVHRAMEVLSEQGCRFKLAVIPQVEDYSLHWMHWRYEFEKKKLEFAQAEELAIADLIDRKSGSTHEHKVPVRLLFQFDFEFDSHVQNRILENLRTEEEDSVKDVDLSFHTDVQDPVFGNRMQVLMTTFEEYVLMYGEEETHRRNKMKILQLAEALYTNLRPYFGWMDDETGSSDESYEPLLKGELPVENEFVFVGPPLVRHLDMDRLKSSKSAWKLLPDSGVLIQNYRRYRDDPPPSLDRII